ncbi:SusC/RagA family TonB-linked outer membrane protein [Bacteroides ovatus]|uniref:SusC/RagA family TonB-linked outer membrane protein n=1 Tax=Bacteroides ovatus TaxID=28116 RepID=UPI001E411ECC|nr:TonB-dependent receptor [Bacteroides ovatus]MDC2625435.1 TonB-dependent receptor [Bacteroides ovatus]MDC2639325.1 TonB-dependent receptor [Bacteroides ovatus]MDC2653380.1 TonB-dependent receptor [Bacteroides ovatus]
MNVKTTILASLFLGIGLFPIHAETLMTESMIVQQTKGIRISGTVLDKEKTPLPGVNITVKKSTVGTITDVDGHFYIEVPDKQSVLIVTYIGFKTKEIVVGNDINFNITLDEDVEALDEVVVVGYGNQKKLSVIGSVQTLEPTKLQVGSSRSMSNNLAGQLAGVIAVQPSGEPGYDNSNFWIRGIASFSGNTSPLVLVDGVERNLNDLDPAEIESFSVLKDASASAMYGVRGANGVIIINTKRGTVAAPSINVRVEQSIQVPTKLPQFIGAAEYMNLLNTLQSDPSKRMFTKDQILKTYYGYDKDLYPDVDWIDAITKDYANSTRANLTVSGGTEILRYSLTASLYHENGIMASDKTLPYDTQSKLNRYNIRANVDLDLTKTTLLRFNVGGYLQNLRKSRSGTDEVFSAAFETPPFVHPAVYSDGTIPVASSNRPNPWAISTQNGYYHSGRSKLESLFAVEQNLKMITPGLKAKVTFAFDTYNENFVTRGKEPDYYSVAKNRNDEGELVHSILRYGSEFLDHSSNANYGNQSVYLEAAITYNRTFADKHAVDALFLYNQRSYDWGDIQPNRTQRIAGRLSYTYDRRYVSEFNFGYNGSENFAKGKRFGFFPSIALGWLISEEHFMEPARDIMSKLKLRASIGSVGNDNIGGRRFAYITTINSKASGYNWGYTGDTYRDGVQEGEVGVENLTWEKALKMNLGLEIGLWNELDLQLDFFKERRTSIFMQRATIPTQIGFINNPYANYGKVDNKGVDVALNYNKRFNKDWNISFRGTFTYAKNTIIERDEPESIKGTYRSITGRSINTLWGLQAEGLFTEDDFENGKLKEGIPVPQLGSEVRPGDIKYSDMNNDGYITAADEGYIGNTTDPRIVYGFGGNINFRGWDFSFFFQGTGDAYRIIGGSDYFIPGSGQGVLGNV